MSNPANYSPYNKTYKFIMFQNQAYHQKNKINAKPHIRSNIRYRPNTGYGKVNISTSFLQNDERDKSPDRKGVSEETGRQIQNRSLLFMSRSLRESNPEIHKPKRVIHKHQSFEKFNNKRIMRDNSKLVSRLVSTSCEVINREKSERSFSNHLRYREIRNKYDPAGNRKHALVVGVEELLCPTLRQYNESGLAGKFIEGDLSWMKNSTSRTRCSIRKSNLSQMS